MNNQETTKTYEELQFELKIRMEAGNKLAMQFAETSQNLALALAQLEVVQKQYQAAIQELESLKNAE